MTAVLYLLCFAGGIVVGVLSHITLTPPPPDPHRPFDYYKSGYLAGQEDASEGLWRGGPLR